MLQAPTENGRFAETSADALVINGPPKANGTALFALSIRDAGRR